MERTWFNADRLVLAGLLLFTLLVRGVVLWAMRGNLQQDPDAYRQIAENLLQHGEFAMGHQYLVFSGESRPIPTAYRPPLYPVVLSNLPAANGQRVSLLKVAALHLALGLATVWLTWAVARRVCETHLANGEKMVRFMHPTIAGLLVACDPLLLNQQTLIMTETLAAFLAVLALWCLARFDRSRAWFDAGLAGGAIGLAVLCRPTFLPWLGVVGVGMFFVRGGRNFRFQISDFRFEEVAWRLANVVALFVVAAVVVSPWAVRNYRVFGKPIVTTTHGGYTLLLGNNPFFYEWLQHRLDNLPWASQPLDDQLAAEWRLWWMVQGKQAEITYDDWCYHKARLTITEQPRLFLSACVYRVGQLWSPLPHKLGADESSGRRMLRYATCAWYCGVYLLAAVGVWRLRWKLLRPPWVWEVLLCLVFTAVHTFYWTNMRMRAPLMPFVAMVAAAALHTSPKRERG